MTGETNLAVLIASMEPELLAETYVYAVVDESKFESLPINAITGFFREREGITVIVQQQHANTLGLAYEGEYRCITLNVHSSLQAVGLTAAFSSALGDENISANVVAGFYHDHIFVPSRDGDKALACLKSLTKRR
ncbi:ACT domain-containing protein [Pseudoalteromonas luteoviolacea]|uniref:ACT domain-containing protein n=1 Tax=Pseudoalteromonas luteoviolacea TaxID=43657 RepID=UPI001B3818E6|nr:ACT domain-containing protein [Pseudoalteromonas luteoviolacea]MBQ4812247.1 ACT domain-containing protein [Pseudoalteromonas luteoviolacea]